MRWITPTSSPTLRSCWLSNFNKEYINADFTHSGKRIHKKKKRIKIMKTTGKKKEYDAARKDCEDRNNARNRDAFAITKANRYLKDEKSANEALESFRSTNSNDVEDSLIEAIDAHNKVEK